MVLGSYGNHEEQAFLQTEYVSKQPSLLENLPIPSIKAPRSSGHLRKQVQWRACINMRTIRGTLLRTENKDCS